MPDVFFHITRSHFLEARAKKPIKVWDLNFDDKVISNLVVRRNNFKYLIGYLDKVIRPFVLIFPKTNAYVKIFKDKGADENKNNKLMFLHVDDDRLLGKYETTISKYGL